jgi:hypothetical protein
MLKSIASSLLVLAVFALSALPTIATAQEARKSPHDTVSVTLGGKKITISYGRPSLKGRKAVGGSLMPYGEVWRTGADEATKLTTDANLTIGDLKVPAGSYALFALPEKERWLLIVNKKADQWGAFNYNQADDLGRTPLAVKQLSSPVEQFTIALEPKSGDSVLLKLAWENTEASTTIRLGK